MAEEQHEYMPLVAAIQPHTDGSASRVCRWTLTAEERARVARGEDVYFVTPAGIRLTPHSLHIGDPWCDLRGGQG